MSAHFDVCCTTVTKSKSPKHCVSEKVCGLKAETQSRAGRSRTHRGGGGDLLSHDLQGVDHGDVAQTLGDGQGGVAILKKQERERDREREREREARSLCVSQQARQPASLQHQRSSGKALVLTITSESVLATPLDYSPGHHGNNKWLPPAPSSGKHLTL